MALSFRLATTQTMRIVSALLLFSPATVISQTSETHDHHAMRMTASGFVMNENTDTLPKGCSAVTEDLHFTIRAGIRYAKEPGSIYGLSQAELLAPGCARIRVTFINEDKIRHQWMVHGLPKYLYPAGMFHIEASGESTQEGSFIVPPEARTYLIHCDIAQHMEKGMRGQLLVASGSGNLWAVAGISDSFLRAPYFPQTRLYWFAGMFVFVMALLGTVHILRKHR
jgi:hypothetical protein